jgi:glucose/arabinose dehydrogenase
MVSRVRVRGGRPTAIEPFVTGFLPPGTETAWERPVDVLVLRDGSMLITGDTPGRVFRVAYTGR